MKSYSQLGEDIFCFQNFMNIPRSDAVLFEIGAFDGSTYSNTLALEQFHECLCVLIEPSPVNVRKIYANRPNASIHRLAIMANFAVCEFIGHLPLSGVQSALTDEYIANCNLKQHQTYNVLSAPVSAVTDLEKITYIDFMSIDVQGAERHVLNSMNWQIPIGVICIEMEDQHPGQDEDCRAILKRRGFELKVRLQVSEFWYRPDYPRSTLLFDPTQKNHPFDSFEPLHFTQDWQSTLRTNFY